MNLLLIILHVIACFLLIVVILIQGGRGQGLTGSNFSSGNVQGLFGTRAADFLTKATSVAAICFLFTCLGLDFVETQKSKSLMQVGKKTAPVDIDAVKKALEKIKAEADAKSKTAAGDVKTGVKDAVAKTQDAATAAANQAVTDVQAAGKDAESDLNKIVAKAQAAAKDVAADTNTAAKSATADAQSTANSLIQKTKNAVDAAAKTATEKAPA